MKCCVSVLSILLIEVVSCGPVQGPVSNLNVTKKFHLHTTVKMNWHRALHYCLSSGMTLATILTEKESNQIKEQLQHSAYTKSAFWLGGTKLKDEVDFYWFGHNKPMLYTDWNTGEPSSIRIKGLEECIEYHNVKGVYKWNDVDCSHQSYFICEEEVIGKTEKIEKLEKIESPNISISLKHFGARKLSLSVN